MIPSPDSPGCPVPISGMATSFEYHLCLCKMSCCRNHLGVRWKNVGKGYCSGDSGQEYAFQSLPLTTLWSSAESWFHAAVQGWAAMPAHFMAHIAHGTTSTHACLMWWGCQNAGTGCPERWWVPQTQIFSRSGWMGLGAIWSSWRCPWSLWGRGLD